MYHHFFFSYEMIHKISPGLTAPLSSAAEVITPVGLVAEVEHPLVLSCNVTFGTGDNLEQVRWYDSQEKLLLAYQLQPFGISHQDDNVQLVTSRSNGSSIHVVKMQPHGSGCYRCAFDIFPSGVQEGKACIKLTGGSAFFTSVILGHARQWNVASFLSIILGFSAPRFVFPFSNCNKYLELISTMSNSKHFTKLHWF